MEIAEQVQGAVRVLTPRGPVVQDDAGRLRDRLRETAAESMGRVVLDVSAVPYVDSVGLEALLDVAEELARTGRSLRLACVNETLREVFELTELTPHMEFFEDVQTAARSFL